MSRRSTIVIAVALAVLAAAVIVVLEQAGTARAPTPVYQGRTAKEWFRLILTTNHDTAFTALQAMGTNALPVLVEAMNDSRWNRFYSALYFRMPPFLRRHIALPILPMTWDTTDLLLMRSHDLRSVFPDLLRLMADKQNRTRGYILRDICESVRPQDKDFTPVFDQFLKDQDLTLRRSAAIALGGIGPEAKAAVPDLNSALKDPIAGVREEAAVALWKVDADTPASYAASKRVLYSEAYRNGGRAVILLYKMAPDDPDAAALLMSVILGNDSGLRSYAAQVLQRRGSKASAVVPVLLQLLQQERGKDNGAYDALLLALKSIDPAAAAKYQESQ